MGSWKNYFFSTWPGQALSCRQSGLKGRRGLAPAAHGPGSWSCLSCQGRGSPRGLGRPGSPSPL